MNGETGDSDDTKADTHAEANAGVLTDEMRVGALGRELAELVLTALPGWVVATAVERFAIGENDTLALQQAGAAAVADLREPLRRFFSLDIDAQRTTPLSIIRSVMPNISAALRGLGVAPVARDAFDERANPNDIYALGPFAWIDLGEDVHLAGLQWGAAKAFVHRKRHLKN